MNNVTRRTMFQRGGMLGAGDALPLGTGEPSLFNGSLKAAAITWRRAVPNL